jgi:phosphoglycolate phosphatase
LTLSESTSRRFELIVFDWDGTLADSTALIVHAIQRAFAEVGLPVPDRAAASYVIGYGLADAMRYLAPDATPAQVAGIVEAYRDFYLSRDGEICLFDGVADSLAALKAEGHLLAVATGKSRKGLDRALVATGLGAYFDLTRCADECHSKPHPQMLHEILEELDQPPERAVMVGDTVHDLQMAANAGVPAVGVSYGAHEKQSLAALSPLAIFDAYLDFHDWVRRPA